MFKLFSALLISTLILIAPITDRKIARFCKFYQDAGTFNHWGWSREKVAKLYGYCEKWKFLAGKPTDINIVDYSMARIHSETDGRYWLVKKEWDGTYSYGLMQLNTKCVYYIEEILDHDYPELKGRNIKLDMEKNIAGGMLWIKHRKECGKKWDYLRPSAWKLYSFLSEIK